MQNKRLLIAGGRDFNDPGLFEIEIEKLHKYAAKFEIQWSLISGGCRGADQMGSTYALSQGWQIEWYLPNWKDFPKAGGVIRNRKMAEKAEFALIFWDGKSKGTSHTISMCKKNRVPIRLVIYNDSK